MSAPSPLTIIDWIHKKAQAKAQAISQGKDIFTNEGAIPTANLYWSIHPLVASGMIDRKSMGLGVRGTIEFARYHFKNLIVL